jgi:hypothetical protein
MASETRSVYTTAAALTEHDGLHAALKEVLDGFILCGDHAVAASLGVGHQRLDALHKLVGLGAVNGDSMVEVGGGWSGRGRGVEGLGRRGQQRRDTLLELLRQLHGHVVQQRSRIDTPSRGRGKRVGMLVRQGNQLLDLLGAIQHAHHPLMGGTCSRCQCFGEQDLRHLGHDAHNTGHDFLVVSRSVVPPDTSFRGKQLPDTACDGRERRAAAAIPGGIGAAKHCHLPEDAFNLLPCLIERLQQQPVRHVHGHVGEPAQDIDIAQESRDPRELALPTSCQHRSRDGLQRRFLRAEGGEQGLLPARKQGLELGARQMLAARAANLVRPARTCRLLHHLPAPAERRSIGVTETQSTPIALL